MNKKFLTIFFALCMVSPLSMANDNKPIIELNTAQMDSVTAGFGESSTTAGASSAGLLAATATQTIALVYESNEGGVAAGGAGAVAAGDDPNAQTSVATETGGASSNTFGASTDFQSTALSFSGIVEISFP